MVGPQHAWKVIRPSSFGFIQPCLQISQYRSVGDFHLTIRLGMTQRGEMVGDGEIKTKHLKHVIVELFSIV